MRFLIILLILYYKENIRNTYLFLNKPITLYNNDYNSRYSNGYDERFSKNETQNISELYRINTIHTKSNLLKILIDNKVSNNKKLDLLKDNTIKGVDLKAGGLLKDFDFNLD